MDSDCGRILVPFFILCFILPPDYPVVPEAGPNPSSQPSETPDLITHGKATYIKKCAACHGDQGLGEGLAAYLLHPKPRDFVAARYRLVSTWERVPTDSDLFGTISRGMPDSAMPSWSHLPERTRWGLVYYVKSLASS